jgi:hypothetical protein
VDLGVLSFTEPKQIVRKGERVAAAHLRELKEAIGAG